MTATSTTRTCLLAGLILSAVGCNSPAPTAAEEPNTAGRQATVELRPVMDSNSTSLHKQRSGRLIKVTNEWVVIDESGAEVWVPKEMVLEIRMGS
jgi:hypothetical protein